MPIKPENKHLYPDNWKEISYRIRFERARGCCESCGMKHWAVIKRFANGSWRPLTAIEWDMVFLRIRNQHSNMTESLKHHGFTRIVLTVAHLDHDPTNNKDENLKALCQKCHNRHDAKHRAQTRKHGSLKNQIKLAL